MGSMIEVFAPGSIVEIHPGGDAIRGQVVAVSVEHGGTVQYRVAWWNGRTRNCDWLHATEVSWIEGAERTRIGFMQ